MTTSHSNDSSKAKTDSQYISKEQLILMLALSDESFHLLDHDSASSE